MNPTTVTAADIAARRALFPKCYAGTSDADVATMIRLTRLERLAMVAALTPATVEPTRYTMRYRPPGAFTLPAGLNWTLTERPSRAGAGFEKRTDLPVSRHPFGVFTTDKRPLTSDELESFEIEVLP
jgi:hypothetical protein